MIVGLRIARLQPWTRRGCFGVGALPLGLSFKNTTSNNGGIARLIFGSLYDLPVVDLALWANIGKARLDVIRSQLDLRSRCRGHQDARSPGSLAAGCPRVEPCESEYRLRIEYRDRQVRLFREQQAIRLDVLASEVDFASGRLEPLDRVVQPAACPARHPPRHRALARLY